MPSLSPLALLFLCGYLLGSISFGVLLARARGIDLTMVGSGNIGATNAARALGRGIGLLVMVLDAAKAAVPMLLLPGLFPSADGTFAPIAVGAGAFLGHLFPIFLRFRGGKGVATAFGAFLVLQPLPALAGLLTYALAYGLSRISSVGSLLSVLLFPLWLTLCKAPWPHFCFAGFLFFFILLRHQGNIRRLLARREHKV